MCDHPNINCEEIEDFLDESFMIVDELEDANSSKAGKNLENGLSDLNDRVDLTADTKACDGDAENNSNKEVIEDDCLEQSKEEASEAKEGEEMEHKVDEEVDHEESELENDTEIEEIASGETSNLDSSGVSKLDEEIEEIKTVESSRQDVEQIKNEEEDEQIIDSHPYLYLIESFELTKEQKTVTDVGPPKSLEETPLHIVCSRNQLLGLLQTLRNAKEIALNFQADHKVYSSPLCCLEISTRDSDYIIDGLKLKNDLLLLTEIFINPKIVKILNKADRVLNYLQQNLHLFVVNVFDVCVVGKALNDGTNINVDEILQNEYSSKRSTIMQNSDFRVRPLTEELKTYCRSLPHYLIYMYHNFKNRLLENKELYKDVMDQCRNICKVLYPHHRGSQLQSIEGELKKRHACELEVLQKLYKWRDHIARKCNKNPDMIIPSQDLLNLALNMPNDKEEVYHSCKTHYVRLNVANIISIIIETQRSHNVPTKLKKQRQWNKNVPQSHTQATPNKEFQAPQGVKRQNDHKSDAYPNKQKKIETTPSKTKNEPPPPKDNHKNQQPKDQNKYKLVNGPVNRNKAKRRPEFEYKSSKRLRNRPKSPNKPSTFGQPRKPNLNRSAPPNAETDNSFKSPLFLNQSAPKPFLNAAFTSTPNNFNVFNYSNTQRRSRFDPLSDSIGSTPTLKPTNVPSTSWFQTNPNYGGASFQEYTSPLGNFGGGKRDDGLNRFEQDNLVANRFQQDNLVANMPQGALNAFNQVFDVIDYKINTLERKVSKFQVTNDPNDIESNLYKRRYN